MLAEELGFDAVWATEHHFADYGGYLPSPCVLLAAIAQRTRRIRLGTGGVALLRDCVKADKWCRDYRGYEGMAKAFEALMDFEMMYEQRSLFGDPAHAHECMDAIIEAGIGKVSLTSVVPGLAQGRILDSLRLFAAEVMPRYTDAPARAGPIVRPSCARHVRLCG